MSGQSHVVNVDVVICTRNRARQLARLLLSLMRLAVPTDASCKVIVVDNASTDRTQDVCTLALRYLPMPVTVLDEPVKGVARCRNRAVEASSADYVAFLDDDVVVDPAWLGALCGCIGRHRPEFVQGRIVNVFARRRFAPFMEALVGGPPGETPGFVEGPMVSANAVVARRLFALCGGFREELGPGRLGFGEDTEFTARLKQSGVCLYYCPEARVRHLLDPARLGLASFMRGAFARGRSMAQFRGPIGFDMERFRTAPARSLLYALRSSAAQLARASSLVLAGDSTRGARLLRDVVMNAGFLWQCLFGGSEPPPTR